MTTGAEMDQRVLASFLEVVMEATACAVALPVNLVSWAETVGGQGFERLACGCEYRAILPVEKTHLVHGRRRILYPNHMQTKASCDCVVAVHGPRKFAFDT